MLCVACVFEVSTFITCVFVVIKLFLLKVIHFFLMYIHE